MEYKFDKARHMHSLDGKPLMGITTVLSVMAKPALIQWAANMAVKYVGENFNPDVHGKDPRDLQKLLDEAKTAHRKFKEAMGVKGTNVHEVIEEMIKACIEHHEGRILTGKNSLPQVQKFIDWAIENKIKFLESEKHLHSEKYWIGGICDMTFEMNGKQYVGDIKTAKAIYPDNFFQMAGYRIMLEENGETDFHGSMVVRLGKDGSFETKERYDYDTDKDIFLACLTIHKGLKQHDDYKSNKKTITL